MFGLVKPAITSAVAGAAVSYIFHRPILDKAGIQTLAKACLPAVGIQVISHLFANFVAKKSDRDDAAQNASIVYWISAVSLTVGAKVYCNWSKTEAAAMFVASSILSNII